MSKEPIKRTMTVTAVERPARKLLLLRSVRATDYFSFCAEMGCGWEEAFNRIPQRLDAAALLTLPENMIKPGTGNTAAGIEEGDFGEAINILLEEMAAYNPAQHGWQYAPELAPYFNFGASAAQGAKMARPARKIGLHG